MDRSQWKEAVRDALVIAVLDVRAEYLAAGASPLKHWDQLHAAVVVAARSSEDVETWVSTLRRRLNLSAPSPASSTSSVALTQTVDADTQEFLDLVESEVGLVMARARLEAERRRDAREAQKAQVA